MTIVIENEIHHSIESMRSSPVLKDIDNYLFRNRQATISESDSESAYLRHLRYQPLTEARNTYFLYLTQSIQLVVGGQKSCAAAAGRPEGWLCLLY